MRSGTRGALLAGLRVLARRVERFGAHRAATVPELHWSGRLHDQLTAAFADALADEGARCSLRGYDRRRQISRKTPESVSGATSLLDGTGSTP
jgi:hypothetical protein